MGNLRRPWAMRPQSPQPQASQKELRAELGSLNKSGILTHRKVDARMLVSSSHPQENMSTWILVGDIVSGTLLETFSPSDFSEVVVVQSLSCVQLLRPRGLSPSRLLCPWDSPGKNTGVGSHSLLQGMFLTQELNPGLLHGRQIEYRCDFSLNSLLLFLLLKEKRFTALSFLFSVLLSPLIKQLLSYPCPTCMSHKFISLGQPFLQIPYDSAAHLTFTSRFFQRLLKRYMCNYKFIIFQSGPLVFYVLLNATTSIFSYANHESSSTLPPSFQLNPLPSHVYFPF